MSILHGQRFGSSGRQEKLVSHAVPCYSGRKLTLLKRQHQGSINFFAVRTLSHIQQTQCNSRQHMAYSFREQ
jgi:hypothetical protein